jgi:hypothetical protein
MARCAEEIKLGIAGCILINIAGTQETRGVILTAPQRKQSARPTNHECDTSILDVSNVLWRNCFERDACKYDRHIDLLIDRVEL